MVATGFVSRVKGKIAIAWGGLWQGGAQSGAPFLFPGPPVSGAGGTLANIAPFGSMLHDTVNGTVYQNVSNAPGAPSWDWITSIPVQPFSWTAGVNPNGVVLFTAPQLCAMTVRVDLAVSEGAAAIIQIVKATGTTPISGGTPVFDSFDCNVTAPSGTMLGFDSDVDLDVGDRLGVTTTGRWLNSSGTIRPAAWPEPL